MNIKTKKFLSLRPSDKVHAMRKTFEVTGIDLESNHQEPILIDVATGQRLYGAMYIVHLMDFEQNAQSEEMPSQPTPSLPEQSESALIASLDNELDNLAYLPPDAFGVIDEFIYVPELLIGRQAFLPYPTFRKEELAFISS